jgi:DNA-binding CsgD family transcriptional regulator
LELTALPWKNNIKPTEQVLRGLWFSAFCFALFTVLIVIDIAHDLASGVAVYHVVLELLMMLAAAAGAFYFWRWLRVARQVERDLAQDLKKANAETVHWQEETRDLLSNLRKVIDKQFIQWEFSPTDRAIAFYLLNGLSLKEIAELRGSTDKSVKQQAYLLYRKAGIGGRAEISAFFLGGLIQEYVAPDEVIDEPKSQEGMQPKL